jgi:hypothetical protein
MLVKCSIYLASKTRWTHLTKLVELATVPRVGEWIKFANAELGDYFPWKVVEVTYREGGEVELMTDLLDDINGRGYSFENESEFDEYFDSYLKSGWACHRGVGPNRRARLTPPSSGRL